ncbi:MAG TPA: NUDIX domain-containing protein [Candidatus Saccharibacteria bacterium]|jgi:ADP-ribose pyrophosphatase YjhB (NUDIX family)|nr:8-oxo-dGTP diphosphatase [Patescibacteria group bacterium]HMS31410.1 NUDIX domain-containing protein [Candidatus Saccharibacteria bacterium]
MSLEVKIHNAQTLILRELLFHPSAGFAELQKPTGLSSDHFNFHISRLIDLDLVEKVTRGKYRLTRRGKEYANKLDTEKNTIERQPKISVILVIWKDNTKQQILLQERLKNPYFGFWGYPTGKISWGETILQTAQRELQEETGLSGQFTYYGIYHEHAKADDSDELLEDKIFLITETVGPTGSLTDAEGCHNEWVNLSDALNFEKKFPGFTTVQEIISGKSTLEEHERQYPTDHF